MEGFREGKGATGAEAEALLEAARRELEVVRRQAAVQGLYKAPHKSYMVRTSPPPPSRACLLVPSPCSLLHPQQSHSCGLRLAGLGERTLKRPLSLFFARACPFSGTEGAGREPSGSRGIELTTRAGLTCLLSRGGMRCYIIFR